MSHAPINWKKIFTGIKDNLLRFFSHGNREGSLLVQPPKQVFEDGDLDWRFSLVGQFIGSAPNFGAMQKVVDMLWGKVSKVKNKPLILRKREPNMCKLDFDLVCMPVWVQLYNVPLELFNKTGLSYIASALGNPLYMDSVTENQERLEYAKVFRHSEKSCVVKEVRTSQVRRQKVLIVCDDRFTASELGESSLQGTAQSELVVPVIEGDVCATSVLGVQSAVVPVDGAEVVVDIEEQALVPMDGVAVDADADFPSLQASVHKKKG
ncbi:hypothetical protein V6N13_104850 [Hibiscus sabdariffa]